MGLCASQNNATSTTKKHIIKEEKQILNKVNPYNGGTTNEHQSSQGNAISTKKQDSKTIKPSFKPISKLTKLDDIHKFYDLLKEIGSGAFGIVREARKNNGADQNSYAIKTIWKSQVDNPVFLSEEIEILLNVDHENIIKCFEVFEDATCIHYVMELIQGGDLFEFIINTPSKKLDEKLALSLFFQMVNAVQYLHIEGFMHRDIKPENFLVYTPEESGKIKIKLIDFGFSCHFKPNEKKKDKVGSINYVAPEMLEEDDDSTYDCKIDVWALGICLYNMLAGKQPFADEDIQILAEKIRKDPVNFSHPVFSTVNHNTKKLIESVLTKDPDTRPSASDIKVNQYLNIMVGTDEQETQFEEFKPKKQNIENIELLKNIKKIIKPIFWNFCLVHLQISKTKSILNDFLEKHKEDLFEQELKSFEEVITIIIFHLSDKRETAKLFEGR